MLLLLLLFIASIICDNTFCDFESSMFQEDNKPYIGGLGNWNNTAYIYVPITPEDPFIVTYVAQLPYWSMNTYNEDSCRFEFLLMWIISCNNVTCPSLPSGFYLGALQNYAPLLPRKKSCKQTYSQVYVTPKLPTFRDQSLWIVDAESFSSNTQMDVYRNATTGRNEYEELISVRYPNIQRAYSAQSYSTYATNFDIQNPWVNINSVNVTDFPEPAATGFALFLSGEFPLVEYAPGKSAYLLSLASKKRSPLLTKVVKNIDILKIHGINLKAPVF